MNKSVLYLYVISGMLRLKCGFCRIEVYTVWGGIRNLEMLFGGIRNCDHFKQRTLFLFVVFIFYFSLSMVSIYWITKVRYSLKSLTQILFSTILQFTCSHWNLWYFITMQDIFVLYKMPLWVRSSKPVV